MMLETSATDVVAADAKVQTRYMQITTPPVMTATFHQPCLMTSESITSTLTTCPTPLQLLSQSAP